MPENAPDGPGDEAPKAQRLGHFRCLLATVLEAWCRRPLESSAFVEECH